MRTLILLFLCFNLQACINEPENPIESLQDVGDDFKELSQMVKDLETDIEDAIDIIGRQQVYLSHSVNKDGFVIPNSSTIEITLSQAQARPYGRKNGKEKLIVDAQIRCTGDIPFALNSLKNNPYYEDYDYSALNCVGSYADVFKGEKKSKPALKASISTTTHAQKSLFLLLLAPKMIW